MIMEDMVPNIVTIPETLRRGILNFCSQNEGMVLGEFLGRQLFVEKNGIFKLDGYQIWEARPLVISKEENLKSVDQFKKQTIISIEGGMGKKINVPIDIIGYWIKYPNWSDNFNEIKLREIIKYVGEESTIRLHNFKYDQERYVIHFPILFAIITNKEKPTMKFSVSIVEYATAKGKVNQVVLRIYPNNIKNATFIPIKKLDIIRPKTDIFSRIQGLLDTDYLINKTVVIVGLGTGGSIGALELAKCGVGKFKLIDFDRLETHNISRHVCGINDIGRFKTHAVKDAILRTNPFAEVKTFEFNILEDEEKFREIIRGTDLVFVATDNELSKLVINRICLEENIPAVYGAAYERAFGGDVIRVIPGETPCYDCIMGKIIRTLDFSQIKKKGIIDYSSISDPIQLKAEPGLSIDVGFIALIQAKFALLTLLRDTDSELEDIPYNMCFWGNKAEWIFSEPFQCRFAETEIREDCETCQRDKYYEKIMGKSKDELQKIAEKIVHDASKRDVDERLIALLKNRAV